MSGLLASRAAAAAVLAAACASTPEARIRREPDLFRQYPPEVQANLREGIVEPGYTPEMVRLALGEPSDKRRLSREDGPVEVWIYRQVSPGYGVGIGTGTVLGPGIGAGATIGMGEPPTGRDAAVVEFRDGRVIRFERASPR